jgi:hypothetical protein
MWFMWLGGLCGWVVYVIEWFMWFGGLCGLVVYVVW